MPHVINSRALTGEKPCINKAIHALLMHGYATFNMPIPRPQNCAVTRCVVSGPRSSIVRGNYVRETAVKRRNKIVHIHNIHILVKHIFNSFGAKFQTTFVVCFSVLTNYRLKGSLYVKLKNWMSNSVDPDETAHLMLFAKACYYRLWQWKI